MQRLRGFFCLHRSGEKKHMLNAIVTILLIIILAPVITVTGFIVLFIALGLLVAILTLICGKIGDFLSNKDK